MWSLNFTHLQALLQACILFGVDMIIKGMAYNLNIF